MQKRFEDQSIPPKPDEIRDRLIQTDIDGLHEYEWWELHTAHDDVQSP